MIITLQYKYAVSVTEVKGDELTDDCKSWGSLGQLIN